MRRHNHIARDLRTSKYTKRVTPRVPKDEYKHWSTQEWLKHKDDDIDK